MSLSSAAGGFIKECVTKVVAVICPGKQKEFNNGSLARNMLPQQIKDLSRRVKFQAKHAHLTYFQKHHAILLVVLTFVQLCFFVFFFENNEKPETKTGVKFLLSVFRSYHIWPIKWILHLFWVDVEGHKQNGNPVIELHGATRLNSTWNLWVPAVEKMQRWDQIQAPGTFRGCWKRCWSSTWRQQTQHLAEMWILIVQGTN